MNSARPASRRRGTRRTARAGPSASPTRVVVGQPGSGMAATRRSNSERLEARRPAARRPLRSSPRTAAGRGRGCARTVAARARPGRARCGGCTAPRRGRCSHVRPCHTSRFGLTARPVRVGHEGIEPDDVGGDVGLDRVGPAAGAKASAPGRKSRPRLSPPLRVDEVLDLLVGLRVAECRRRPRSTTSSGTGSPRARPISPASHSATSARGPWPAPRNFTTYRPSSSASRGRAATRPRAAA